MTGPDVRASVLIGLIVIGLVSYLFWGGWDGDLSAIYFAAYSYGTGQADLIYLSQPEFFGSSASREWDQMATDMGYAGNPVLPYIYAPIWAAVLAPIAVAVSVGPFFNAVLVIHAAACVGSMVLAWRIARPATVGLPLWMVVSAVIVALTTPFLHMIWAGIILGVAAALKLTPAILVFIFLINRNWTAAGVTVVTGLGLLGASIAICGIDMHIAFAEQMQRAGSHLVLTPINFSAEGVLTTLYHSDLLMGNLDDVDLTDGNAPFAVIPTLGGIGTIAKGLLLCLIACLWFVSKGKSPRDVVFGQLIILWCAIIFFGPLGWSHYLIGPLALLPGIFAYTARGWAVVWIGLITAALSHPFQVVLANLGSPLIGPVITGAMCLLVISALGFASIATGRKVDSR